MSSMQLTNDNSVSSAQPSSQSLSSTLKELGTKLLQAYNRYQKGQDFWDVIVYKDKGEIPGGSKEISPGIFYKEQQDGKSLIYTQDAQSILDPGQLDIVRHQDISGDRKISNRLRLVWKDVMGSNDPNVAEARDSSMATAAIDDNFNAIASTFGYKVPSNARALFSDSLYEGFRTFPAYIVGYETTENGQKQRHLFDDRGAIAVGDKAQILGKINAAQQMAVDQNAYTNRNAKLNVADRMVPGAVSQAMDILTKEFGFSDVVQPILQLYNWSTNDRQVRLTGYISADGKEHTLDGDPRTLTGKPEKERLAEKLNTLSSLTASPSTSEEIASTRARASALQQLSAYGIPENSDVMGRYDATKGVYLVTMAVPPGYKGPAKDVMYKPPLSIPVNVSASSAPNSSTNGATNASTTDSSTATTSYARLQVPPVLELVTETEK